MAKSLSLESGAFMYAILMTMLIQGSQRARSTATTLIQRACSPTSSRARSCCATTSARWAEPPSGRPPGRGPLGSSGLARSTSK